MGFFEQNKNFITQELLIKMRGLNTLQREERYSNIKLEVHERVLNSYNRTLTAKTSRGVLIDKSFFYIDLINCLGDYEVEFILYNLFYEDEMFEIIQYLNKIDFLEFLSKKNRQFNFITNFFIYIVKQKKRNIYIQSGILVNYLHKFLPRYEETWYQKAFKDEKGIIILYSKNLIDNLSISSINWNQIIFIDALFFKVWYLLPYFKKRSMSKKIIILDYLKNHHLGNLNLFITKHTMHKRNVFSNKIRANYSFLNLNINLEYHTAPVKYEFLIKNIKDVISNSSYLKLFDFIISLNNTSLKKTYDTFILENSNNILNKIEDEFNEKSELIKIEQDFFTIETLFKDLIELRSRHIFIQKQFKEEANYSKVGLFNLLLKQKITLNMPLTYKDVVQIEELATHNTELEIMKNLLFKRFYLFEKI